MSSTWRYFRSSRKEMSRLRDFAQWHSGGSSPSVKALFPHPDYAWPARASGVAFLFPGRIGTPVP